MIVIFYILFIFLNTIFFKDLFERAEEHEQGEQQREKQTPH